MKLIHKAQCFEGLFEQLVAKGLVSESALSDIRQLIQAESRQL